MVRRFIPFLSFLIIFYCKLLASEKPDTFDLSGTWYYRLHNAPMEIPGEGNLVLPGSLDSNRKGIPVKDNANSSRLSRNFEFEGQVSYFKTVDIPLPYANQPLAIKLERTRPSQLFIDGEKIGNINYLSAPHIYVIEDGLTAGSHELEIIIDNKDSIPSSIRKNSNQASENTQTNWNGIIGELFLIFNPDFDDKNKKEVTSSRLKVKDGHFYKNDHPVFLRGTVNNAIHPLTGFPPMDKESWLKYFKLLKSYGINHVRFHSWCPPEAAFSAADDEEIYLQIELPVWGEIDRDLEKKNIFLKNELDGILKYYSHHPSFSLFTSGNELWGDISLMKEFSEKVKEYNSEILVASGTDIYNGLLGITDGEDDFLVASRIGGDEERKTDIRGSFSFADSEKGGNINRENPNSNTNYDKILEEIKIPVITHELGQFQTYPDFNEIEKYKGVLRPDNLKEFKRRAIEAGTIDKAPLYRKASSIWSAKLYKNEIEKQLRSKGINGFQLMSLTDYPGQGTSLVGLLNSFMNPKTNIDSIGWTDSCKDVVILAEFPKFTFSSNEAVSIPIKLANYSSDKSPFESIEWQTEFNKGNFMTTDEGGLSDIGVINIKIPETRVPVRYSLDLKGVGSNYKNKYDFWVYPDLPESTNEIFETGSLPEALDELQKGRSVLLVADSLLVSETTLDPLFATDFWNYRMYRTICDQVGAVPSPGTLGLLINNTHPSLNYFPSEIHTDWQWYSIIQNTRPLIIDRLPEGIDPIIEVIDNVEQNYRLALLLECRVGKGKLMIIPGNLQGLNETPVGSWFLYSIKQYMASKKFNPKLILTPQQIENLLTKPSTPRLIKQLKNETYDSHWD